MHTKFKIIQNCYACIINQEKYFIDKGFGFWRKRKMIIKSNGAISPFKT